MPEFTKAKRSVDRESRKPKLSSQPKGDESHDESDKYVSDQSDSELESIRKMPFRDDSRRTTLKPTTKRKTDSKITTTQKSILTTKETSTPDATISEARHMLMVSSVYHVRIAPITYPVTSTYIPSSYMFFEALHAAHKLLEGNTYLERVCPDYFSIASRLYYSILFYIQILRAKHAAGIITRNQSTCLRKFEREYPLESLPIMSPLILFFQTLGAVKLSDPMYSWICPTLPEIIGTDANTSGTLHSDAAMPLPNVPFLLTLLQQFSSCIDATEYNSDGQVIVPSFTSGTNFLGLDFVNQNAATRRTKFSAGTLEPVESAPNLDISVARRIKRWGLPTLTSQTNLQSIGDFLQLMGNSEWFKQLVIVATHESKFFAGSTNLSNIGTTAGLESLIEVKYVGRTRPTSAKPCYPLSEPSFRDNLYKAQATTTRGETTASQFRTGATTQLLVTSFGDFAPINNNAPTATVTGPYFDDSLNARQVNQHESDPFRSPSYLFSEIILTHMFENEGNS